MLKISVNKYDSIFMSANSTPVQLNTTNDAPKALQLAAEAGSNDTAVDSIAQELAFGGKIKIRFI